LKTCTRDEIDLLVIGYKYNRGRKLGSSLSQRVLVMQKKGNHIRQDGKIRIMTLVLETFSNILSGAFIYIDAIIKKYSLRSQVREVLVDIL
jgi:hypothetical protein